MTVAYLTPPGFREAVQINTPTVNPTKFKKLEKLTNQTLPVVESAKVATVNQETERVYCGSSAQRNWKNSNATNIAIGQRLAAERGWVGSQFDALKELWSCESSWTTTAGNTAGSGAYGIPQSLPASKMSSFGADYLTNPETQIKWGLDYIEKRYGTPQVALNQHYAKNWY
jgi:hypothetical protein